MHLIAVQKVGTLCFVSSFLVYHHVELFLLLNLDRLKIGVVLLNRQLFSQIYRSLTSLCHDGVACIRITF